MGKLAKVTRLDMVFVAMMINDLVSQRPLVIAEKKALFGAKKAKNND